MTVDFKFNLNQWVLLEPINVKGRIIRISYDRTGPEYQVRYFDNSKIETVWFLEDEIVAI